MKKLYLIVIVLAIVGGLGYYYYHSQHLAKSLLVLYGNVDIREVNLGFRVAGKLATLVYDEGDQVKAGEVIAKLDDEPYINQVASAAAQLKSLKERLKLRENGNRPQEIAQARALVKEREVTSSNAYRLLERAEKSLEVKGISAQDKDNAEASYQESLARLLSARENLALLASGFRVEDVAQAKADLEQAEATLAIAKLQLKDTLLTAPADGIILTRAQEAGAIVQAGNTVFSLSLQQPVWVRAYIHEADLGRIHPGTKVQVYSDTNKDKAYQGQVGYISPRAEFTPKTVETSELRTSLVYRLRIVIEQPDVSLRQGMPVTIKLASDQPATLTSGSL